MKIQYKNPSAHLSQKCGSFQMVTVLNMPAEAMRTGGVFNSSIKEIYFLSLN
jgi:hypothetical protein